MPVTFSLLSLMARPFKAIVLLLTLLAGHAQVVIPGVIMRTIATAGGGCTTVSGSLLFETFEGPGYVDGNWVPFASTGVVDDTYDTAPAPLAGSFSLYIENPAGTGTSGTRNSAPATPQGHLYFFCKVNVTSLQATSRIFAFENSMGTEVYSVDINSSGALIVNNGATASSATTTTLTAGTTYYVRGEYQKVAVANDAISRVEVNTTGIWTGSGNGFREVTNGTMTTDVTDVVIKITNNGGQSKIIFDTYILDDAQIPDTPCDTP